MKLAFSTLGCPNWELERIAQAAHAFGYEGVELRALGGDLDLLNRSEFRPSAVASTRQWFADHRIKRPRFWFGTTSIAAAAYNVSGAMSAPFGQAMVGPSIKNFLK